jgi:ubiquitin-conjugating enzyme E2 Z
MATADITVPKYVEKDTLRRIISDVREIRKNPLTAHGIHYEHDETDMMHGKALIIGPSETPYADGFYLFKIKFPTNYPHAPPTVDFCTSDGYTRFNPNLYRSGKVCLSILNTWRGEPWSGCQTLSSVLLAICTVLNAEPLLNEPGVLKIHVDFDKYNAILQYKNIEVAIFGVLQKVEEQQEAYEFAMFGPIMREHFLSVKEKIRQKVAAEAEKSKEPNSVTVIMYKMTVVLDYQGLVGKF